MVTVLPRHDSISGVHKGGALKGRGLGMGRGSDGWGSGRGWGYRPLLPGGGKQALDGGDEDEHDEGAHQVGLEHLVPHLGVLAGEKQRFQTMEEKAFASNTRRQQHAPEGVGGGTSTGELTSDLYKHLPLTIQNQETDS